MAVRQSPRNGRLCGDGEHTATLEDNTQSTEQAAFRNYSRVTNDLFDHTDAGTTYNKAHLLNGGNNSQVGLAKTFAVMPGDVITAQVYAKHYDATGSSGNLAGFAAALLSAFGLPAPIAGEVGTASAAIQSYGTFIAGGGNPGNPAWTKGFLNILIFDKNYNLVDLAYQQLDAAYSQPVGSSTKMPHQLLTQSKTIKEPGYVYIYLSNEGTVQKDIYFDDLSITHAKSKIIQAQDYYPFGLTFNSYQRENSITSDFQYSGKEKQDELGLQWLDFGARMYDAQIARWHVTDPLADFFDDWSPYAYAYNNPIRYIDPLGMANEDTSDKGDPRRPPNSRDPGTEGPREDGFAGAKGLNSTRRNNDTGSSTTVAGCGYCPSGGLVSGPPGTARQATTHSGVNNQPGNGSAQSEGNSKHWPPDWEAGGDAILVILGIKDPFEDMPRPISSDVPDLPIGPGGAKITLKAVKILIKQKGIWKWAVNGRVASKETLKKAGLAKPSLSTTKQVSAAEKAFEKSITGIENSSGPLSKWEAFKRAIATIMGNLPF